MLYTFSTRIFYLFLFIILFLSAENGFGQTPRDKAPNIIMIVTDDQGWGDLSVHGNKNLQTPNVDALAKQGAQFQHFYVSPVCSPTRAELLTGRYHPRTGVYSTSAGGERMDLDETTVADMFNAAGYATAAFGKWHNGMQYPYHPNARGFDEFYGFCSGHWGDYFSPMLEHNGEIVQGNGFIANDFTEHALSYIEANQDHPFFLYLAFNTPHSPMQVPDSIWSRFENRELSMKHHDPAKEEPQFTRAALALCENIDWNVGRIMNTLSALQLEENTIVLYMSDNGPNSWRWNGNMKGRKGSTDEGGVRSPLFIRWPGHINANTVVTPIASVIDLLPTMTDLASIKPSANRPLDGISLKPLLLQPETTWPDRYIFQHWNGQTSVRSQTYRLDGSGHLFNMEQDPGQTQNIAEKEPEVTTQMTQAADQWNKTILAELNKEDERPFPLGHLESVYTQLPARDAIPHGHIKRSNKYPNCTYLTHWISVDDSITWNVDVLAEGDFEVTVYYTCPKSDIGATFELSVGSSSITGRITEAHASPLAGQRYDRVPRMESYTKDFKPLSLGAMHLKKGKNTLLLKALDIPGAQVMDLRLILFTRVGT